MSTLNPELICLTNMDGVGLVLGLATLTSVRLSTVTWVGIAHPLRVSTCLKPSHAID